MIRHDRPELGARRSVSLVIAASVIVWVVFDSLAHIDR